MHVMLRAVAASSIYIREIIQAWSSWIVPVCVKESLIQSEIPAAQ